MVIDLGHPAPLSVPYERRWPTGPADFDALAATKHFADPDDRDVACALYRKASCRQLGGAKSLQLDHMKAPTLAEARRLSGCLGLCVGLEHLSLRSSGISDRMLKAMCARLPDGSLPRLTELDLSENPLKAGLNCGLDSLCAARAPPPHPRTFSPPPAGCPLPAS